MRLRKSSGTAPSRTGTETHRPSPQGTPLPAATPGASTAADPVCRSQRALRGVAAAPSAAAAPAFATAPAVPASAAATSAAVVAPSGVVKAPAERPGLALRRGVRAPFAQPAAAAAAAALSLLALASAPAARADEGPTATALRAEEAEATVAALGASSSGSGGARGSGLAAAPAPGAGLDAPGCPDGLCPGEVNGTLNTCSLAAPSCVSVMADDGSHFVAPWTYDTDTLSTAVSERGAPSAAERREAAVQALLYVATGGYYEPGLSTDPYVTNGYSRFDATGYLFQEAFSSVTGRPPPARPQPVRDARGFRPFDGELVDRHTTQDGSIYLRIRFGGSGGASGGGGGGVPEESSPGGAPLDAEFLFPANDSIVTLRCAEASAATAGVGDGSGAASADGGGGVSGGGGGLGVGRLALSFERGIEWDTNEARRRMESLRKALRWEVVPVVAEFDPQFNDGKPLWFERLYAPFRAAGASGAPVLEAE